MSDISDTQRDLLALCCLTDGGDRCDWGVIARQAHRERTLDALKEGAVVESGDRAHRTGWLIATASPAQWAGAYEHGKQVFLIESLAAAQPWARTMLERGQAVQVRDFDDLARQLVDADRLLTASKELHLTPFAL